MFRRIKLVKCPSHSPQTLFKTRQTSLKPATISLPKTRATLLCEHGTTLMFWIQKLHIWKVCLYSVAVKDYNTYGKATCRKKKSSSVLQSGAHKRTRIKTPPSTSRQITDGFVFKWWTIRQDWKKFEKYPRCSRVSHSKRHGMERTFSLIGKGVFFIRDIEYK